MVSRIDDLCGQLSLGVITRATFLEQCARVAGERIGCSRAGVWVFLDTDQGRQMRCLGIYDRVQNVVVRVEDRTEQSAGPYFEELERMGHVMAENARAHPATRAFFDGSFSERRLVSLMAAAFSLNGKLFGALTCTQLDEPMAWSYRQLGILTKIGSRVTLALAGASVNQLDSLFTPFSGA
jgi:galactokinase